MKPIVADLYCGLGGWAEGFIAEGFEARGYDIEAWPYPGTLIIRDVLEMHGREVADTDVIVASPPCQEPSYRAMPWKRAKALNAAGPPHNFIALFEACFRIQREASEAAGHYIPMVVENVKGAQPWVGRAKWHFGSFYLWGDVPALMPSTRKAKVPGHNWNRFADIGEVSPHWRMGATKGPGGDWFKDGRQGQDACIEAIKNAGGSWFAIAHNTTSGHSQNPDGRLDHVKGFNGVASGSGNLGKNQRGRLAWSTSDARKMASAQIAKIPFHLARHIARVYKPQEVLTCS